MARPVFIHDRPHLFPNICVVCGLSGPPRLYFVDLGLQIPAQFQVIQDGALYFCNECYKNKTEEADRVIQAWEVDHDLTYKGSNRVDHSFEWKRNLDLSTLEVQIGRDNPDPDVSDSEPDGNDQESEPDDPVPTGTSEDSDDDDPDVPAFNAIFNE